ncbi:MAG: hypothetical protein AAB049_02590, partial [Nitrospirota bacterium]
MLLDEGVTLVDLPECVGRSGLPRAHLTLEDGRLTLQFAIRGFDLIQPCRQAGQFVPKLSIDCQQLSDGKTRRREERRREEQGVVHDARPFTPTSQFLRRPILDTNGFGEYL